MSAATSSAAFERAQRAFRDGSALRAVGRAQLKVDQADQAWSARQALEDGLNTADFADCGRLIVVRHLHVHLPSRGLEGGARGPAVARAIEAAWRALAPSAMAFDAPGAISAPAVFFRSATAARLAWLQCVAESRPVDAWFWRSALPELAAAPSADGAVAAVFAAVRSEEPQAVAMALRRWPASSVRQLFARQPALSRWLEARWPVGALKSALEVTQRASPQDANAAPGATVTGDAPAAEHAERVAWLASLDLHDDTVMAALTAMMLAPVDPSSAPLARVAAVVVEAHPVRRALGAARVAPIERPSTASRAIGESARSRPSDQELDPPAVERHPRDAATDLVPLPIPALPVITRVQRRESERRSRWPWLASNEPTTHGGFLLLLNVLHRMQIEPWLKQHAPAERQPLVALLFETLADRLRMPADDPQRALLTAAGAVRDDLAAREAIDLWVRRLRRVLRLQARIGLASLVRRDAGIAISATHVDVVMPLNSADLRVRRAGLDSDPGWLPWFGWIVKLHYVDVD